MDVFFGYGLIIIGLIIFILALWAFIEVTLDNCDYIYRSLIFNKLYIIAILCLLLGYMLISKKPVLFVLWVLPIYFFGSMTIVMLLDYLLDLFELKK
ncbi:hypothetical protein SE18_04570 [Herpetosiphon geysericola]|uniref:Uncharacterized protein n=1 Tax=Herpetosiphon geysericola TaxID=70996 RepID=A0A0P6Y4J8_9CHLR|nr:hypothetical protein SE18_04570 [Herpetosiphon geysericola]